MKITKSVCLRNKENHKASQELEWFFDSYQAKYIFDLLFEMQISPSKAREALCQLRAGNIPALPEELNSEKEQK